MIALALAHLALAHLALAPLGHAQEAAEAEEPAGFDALVARAMQHYSAREYEPAIELFQRAYEVRAEPELVYNIARSYERLARGEEALREYERFVALPGTTSELRSRALASIQALREEQRRREATTRAAQPPAPVEDAVAPEPSLAPEVPARASSGGSDGLSVSGWILFGTGAVAVVVGAALGGLAIARNDAFEQETLFERKLELRDEVRTYALATDFLLIGGGAVALAGLIMGIVGATSGASDVSVLVGPGLAGITLDGRF